MTRGSSLEPSSSWATLSLKGTSPDSLLQTLKVWREELEREEQGDVDHKILDHIREQLSAKNVLSQKNPDVRINAANCMAELLKHYAPDCPYDDGQVIVSIVCCLHLL